MTKNYLRARAAFFAVMLFGVSCGVAHAQTVTTHDTGKGQTAPLRAPPVDRSWIDPDTGFLKSPEIISNPEREQKPLAAWEVDPEVVANRQFLFNDRLVIERDLAQTYGATCGSANIRVELDRPSFLASADARKNVKSYAEAIDVSLKDICKDNRTRLAVAELLSIIKLVNDPKMLKPEALGDIYTVTITYAFSSKIPMQAKELTPRLLDALKRLVRQYYERRDPARLTGQTGPVAVPEE